MRHRRFAAWAVGIIWLMAAAGCGSLAYEKLTLRPDGGIVVVTFNLRVETDKDVENAWQLRRDLAVNAIEQLSPDILGTQEGKKSQITYLDWHLKGYRRYGVARNDGKSEGEFSAIFLRRSRFDVKDSGTFWLSPTPEVPGSKGWDAAYPRVVTWVRAVDRACGKKVMIVNTHWDNRGREARRQSAKMIHAWLGEHVKDEAVIFTGDLNSREDTPQVKLLLAEDGTPRLFDAYREVHPAREPTESSYSNFNGKVLGSRIDFICHSGELEAIDAAIARVSKDGRYPSDHYPVAAVLRWRTNAPGATEPSATAPAAQSSTQPGANEPR